MNNPPNQLVDNLLGYFRGQGHFEGLGIDKLSDNYVWPKRGSFPSYSHLADVTEGDGDNYAKNITLKEQSPRIWIEGSKLEISKWVVSDWGGIKGNKPATIANYVEAICEGRYPSEIKGVASYSKILSFMDPSEFAIYDARVAISLNAIQLLQREKHGTAFTYLPGRNTKLQIFRKLPPTQRSALLQTGWSPLASNDCYAFYLSTLKRVRSELGSAQLYKLEMSLFADAEELAGRYIEASQSERASLS
ncbi:hypothetical protein [Ruegeria arenilitoris]|uniref:hypothetical protein n=1 Tax=Ruegeria arenilitoris TaxID=1173585 RepID=UPI001479CCF2|nr:hypothetical protein [Ruegeria arenilitoris]